MSTTEHGVGATTNQPAPHGSAGILTDASQSRALRYVLGAVRLSIGWVFLWAFLDKLFALGFNTGRDAKTGVVSLFGPKAWINGGSPTKGFLSNSEGPFSGFYQSFAGAPLANWLFMIGLLGIGLALMLGVAMRIASVAGAVLLLLMWTAVLPTSNNPFMDDHIIYALTLGALMLAGAGTMLGLGQTWNRLDIVQRHSFLR